MNRIGVCTSCSVRKVNAPVIVSPFATVRVSAFRVASSPVNGAGSTVADAVCEDMHTLSCPFVGERGCGSSNSSDCCFAVGGYCVGGVLRGQTMCDTNGSSAKQEQAVKCLFGIY